MSENEKTDKTKGVVIPKQPGSQYTDEQRRAVLVDYMVTGNATKTAELNNIPRRTVSDWINSDWGVEQLAKIRHEKGEEFDANLTKLIDSSFEQAQDRVENGDYRVGKDDKLIRVPMGGKELVITGATVFDKQCLHRGMPTSIQGDSKSIQQLAEFFREISREHKIRQVNSIEGEFEEV